MGGADRDKPRELAGIRHHWRLSLQRSPADCQLLQPLDPLDGWVTYIVVAVVGLHLFDGSEVELVECQIRGTI